MSRAVLFCNGEISDVKYHKSLLRDDDFIIAVDGGGRYCKALDIIPAVALGDFDSLAAEIKTYFFKQNVEMIPFPTDKDYIDMVLGIEEAKNRGYEDILILGAFGGKRADMYMANLLALAAYDEHIVLKNEWSEVRFLRENRELILSGEIGDYVSLIPLSDRVTTGKSSGLKYQLETLVFQRGETRSVSNELISETASFKIVGGNALVVTQKR